MMSSVEPTTDLDMQEQKKRKIKRACDTCRRKKIGCDGPQISGSQCTNCIASSSDCTYTTTEKRPNPKDYVVTLENRLNNLEKLLGMIAPDVNFEQLSNLNASSFTEKSATNANPQLPVTKEHNNSTPQDVATPTSDTACEDDTTFESVTYMLKQVRLESDHRSFFGKSSQFMLIKTALDLKNEFLGQDPNSNTLAQSKRPEFWKVPPWEQPTFEQRLTLNYVFPDEDLMEDLINIFFTETNRYMPLLHRPTFEKSFNEGLHRHDDAFGAVVLLMCAVASRFSNDPRVFIPEANCHRSCGWQWFDQVRVMRTNLLIPPSLYDVQFCCLSVIFLYGSSAPHSAWMIIGIGVRFAQEVGAHRRRPEGHIHTVQDELWKRAFWVLINMDRHVSAAVGRPCAVHEEDYDLDYPIECDDEYWEHPDPDKAFTQPPGKPSIVVAFNYTLRLGKIAENALRTIYAIHKPKNSVEYDQKVVAELDSQLNQWADSVPDHLRWDPNREDQLFFRQSAAIYANYYHLQIMVHRPFISAPRNPSRLTFPSLAIITTAARTCSHIIQRTNQRGIIPFPPVQLALFTSAVVLLFHIWGGKRAGLSVDLNKGMEDVHSCMKVLKTLEDRWHSAGRCWDILYELASLGDLPLPPSPPSNKRERNQYDLSTEDSEMSMPRSEASEGPRQLAGSRRVASKYALQPNQSMPTPPEDTPTPFTLPTSSEELGHFPYFPSDCSSTIPPLNPELFPATALDDHHLFPPVVADGSSWPTDMNMGPNMDDLFYDQMATIFSTPFGEMTEEELATTILNSSTAQNIPNDEANMWYQAPVDQKHWGSYQYQ